MKTDILIVGSGCAGLYCALQLPREKQITIITKSDLESSDSFLAQGGMCVLRDEADYDSFMEDTLKAGHYENDRHSVDVMIRSSRDVLQDLISYGVDFNKDENGELLYTREGAHSNKRILFHADITGKEITRKLLAAVKKLPNVTIYEHTAMIDLLVEENTVFGAVVKCSNDEIELITAEATVLATGGIGGLYAHSTNFRHLTGDALAVAMKYGIELKDIDYIQIHPTTFYTKDKTERSFLISESVRGEGAKLRDKKGNRFVDELLPRDLLTKAILEQMEKDGTEHVWEDLRDIPEEELNSHFPNIVKHCLEHGYDVRKECIPVVPAQHYFMGGIKVNDVSKTSMEALYAIGETACNGVHGKNRLASNSLLESLVFAKRAAKDIAATQDSADKNQYWQEFLNKNRNYYEDEQALEEEYRELVLNEIEKAKEAR
ncbi:MAG: L-aspartate oxidase [Agathobacter sp.]|nr:L-aspartate oxidase [Agathobacter sp.]